MIWLLIAAILAFLIGCLLLISGETVSRLSSFFNLKVLIVDDNLKAARLVVGFILLTSGFWLVSVAIRYPMLWVLNLAGALAFIFAALYLFWPEWLERISRIADQYLFATDDAVIGTRKITGFILILLGLYILCCWFRIRS
jgi:hypothetical protein